MICGVCASAYVQAEVIASRIATNASLEERRGARALVDADENQRTDGADRTVRIVTPTTRSGGSTSLPEWSNTATYSHVHQYECRRCLTTVSESRSSNGSPFRRFPFRAFNRRLFTTRTPTVPVNTQWPESALFASASTRMSIFSVRPMARRCVEWVETTILSAALSMIAM